MARCRPALFWKEFVATGSFEPTKRARDRRADCQLTLCEIDWIAERILDTPDLLISELRRVFVHVHPAKAFVSDYAIIQALIVRTTDLVDGHRCCFCSSVAATVAVVISCITMLVGQFLKMVPVGLCSFDVSWNRCDVCVCILII